MRPKNKQAIPVHIGYVLKTFPRGKIDGPSLIEPEGFFPPIFMDPTPPKLDDPSGKQSPDSWRPINPAAFKLMRCVEAMRDLSATLPKISGNLNSPGNRRRFKQIATPLYNFATSIRDLFNELRNNRPEYEDLTVPKMKHIQFFFDQFEQVVPLDDGPLRMIRDKLASHIDKKVFSGDPRQVWRLVEPRRLLSYLRNCIATFTHFLIVDAYAWSRNSGDPRVTRRLTVDGKQVDCIDGDPRRILRVYFVPSPRQAINDICLGLVGQCERLLKEDLSWQFRLRPSHSKHMPIAPGEASP